MYLDMAMLLPDPGRLRLSEGRKPDWRRMSLQAARSPASMSRLSLQAPIAMSRAHPGRW